MWKKSDEEFLSCLDDGRKLERRIAELTNQRRWSLLLAIGFVVFIFAQVFFALLTYHPSISANTPSGFNVSPGMMLVPLLFLILLLQQGANLVIAHCEIRTLLMFKKLRDDKSVDAP